MQAVVHIDAAIAGLQAMRSQLLAGVGQVAVADAMAERLDPGLGVRDAACEVALMVRRHDRTVEADISRAMDETEHWPATLRAWGDLRIHRGHVAVIAEVGAVLQDAEARAAFEEALLPHAEQLAPGRLRALAQRELEQHLGKPLQQRHRSARQRRGVWVRELDDGMSQLTAIVPTVLASGVHDRLTQMAKAAARAAAAAHRDAADLPIDADFPIDAEADRSSRPTFDQLRADLFCDLLLTGDPTDDALAGIQAKVSVVIPPEVLLEEACADDGVVLRTGEIAIARLATGAPVDPETARLLAARAATWIRLFTDPVKGQVLAVDTYTPSDALKRMLRARDQHCRWPGCGQPAVRCDVDHTKPWAARGKTEHGNLAHFCRRHHTLKGAQLSGGRRWKVHQPSPGVLVFTSPTGKTSVDEPPQVGPVFREPASETWGLPTGVAAPRGDQPF